MAPEQARMQPTDRRADVFSLGVVLYELLADVKPFRGNSLQEITTAVLEHEPPLANVVDPRVPKALADIAAQAMAKDPEHRYRSARAFSRELRHWLEENVGPDGGVATALPDDPPKRSRLLAVAAVVGAAALWFALSSHRGDAPAEALAVAAPAPAALPVAATPVASSAAPSVATSVAAAPAPVAVAVAPVAAPAEVVVAPPAPKAALPSVAIRPTVSTLPKDTAKDRRNNEAREREQRVAAAKPASTKPAAPLATGVVRIAVSPWGHVEVDGKSAGTTPPLNELTLPEGPHKITFRNEDFPAHTTTVNVVAGQPVSVKHKFGS
jgi:serine/threonine-protein kinase